MDLDWIFGIAIAGLLLYLYVDSKGTRAVNSIIQQGQQNASLIPQLNLDPGLSIPGQAFNWGGYSPGDFLVSSNVQGD